MIPPALPSGQVMPRHITQINGKPRIAHMTRTGSGRKQVISWMDAPDDVYFRATEASKYVELCKLRICFLSSFMLNFRKRRKQISSAELRRAARKPWRQLKTKDEPQVVVLD